MKWNDLYSSSKITNEYFYELKHLETNKNVTRYRHFTLFFLFGITRLPETRQRHNKRLNIQQKCAFLPRQASNLQQSFCDLMQWECDFFPAGVASFQSRQPPSLSSPRNCSPMPSSTFATVAWCDLQLIKKTRLQWGSENRPFENRKH